MKKSVILIVLIVLITSISFAQELKPGRLFINNVEIPYSLEKIKKEPRAISYVYANGQRIAKVENNEVYYFHNDHLGSPAAITNSKGEVVWQGDYKPFGETFNEVSFDSGSNVKYNSKELDKDTELHYYGARYYNAPNGRFITADIVKGELVDPQSLNLYIYTKNNPLKYIDLSGMQEVDYKQYLRENEYVLPDKIIDIFANIVDPRPMMRKGPSAGHMGANFLKDRKKETRFFQEVAELGLDYYRNSRLYYKQLTTPGSIIIKESVFTDKSYSGYFSPEKVISHERMHYEISKLSIEEQRLLYYAREKMISRRTKLSQEEVNDMKSFGLDIEDEWLFQPKIEYNMLLLPIFSGNWEEAYTYLNQGLLKNEDKIIKTLKEEFPEEYNIYQKVKERNK